MKKQNMLNGLGKGWHEDFIRHSNAKLLGVAGGPYKTKNKGITLKIEGAIKLPPIELRAGLEKKF